MADKPDIQTRILKLPKWAQEYIASIQSDKNYIEDRKNTLERMQSFYQAGREWFTIPGPKFNDNEKVRYLWSLSRDGAHAICDLGPNDLLFVGRAKRD